MGLTENHLLNDEGGAWEPIGGWSDKPNLSPYPQPGCCQSVFPQGVHNGIKYPRKEYIALLDVLQQAIDDYKEAVDELKDLEARGPQRTLVSENDVAIGDPRPDADDVYNIVTNHYREVIKKIERQINFVSWMLASVVKVVDDESE